MKTPKRQAKYDDGYGTDTKDTKRRKPKKQKHDTKRNFEYSM